MPFWPGVESQGGSVTADPTDVINAFSTTRLEKETQNALRRYGAQAQTRIADAGVYATAWADTSTWTGTGVVASGRVYATAGITRAAPTSTRWVARTTLHATGATGKFAYFGAGASTAAADLVGIGQGSASTTAAILRGTNIAAANVVIPRTMPALTAGDYIVTVAADETVVSFSIQSIPTGQNVYGARVLRSAFPNGTVNTIFLSANDTTAGGLNFGPLVIFNELAVPPAASRVVGSTTLFGTGLPLVFYRQDPTTGIGHIVTVPGTTDHRVPSPMVLFLHQATTGVASVPWTEARMANVLSALDTAGYILIASDNGPGIVGAGTQDKFGNAAGQADYVAAVSWARQHFNTGALFLLGPSQGSFFAQNLLAGRALGGIHAVATISGGSDLNKMANDPTYQAALLTAYGASSVSDFATKVVGFNPIDFPASQFRGVPQRFYVGTQDTTSVVADQVTPFITKIASYVPEAQVISANVGHLDASLYQGSDLVSFFEKYR